MKYAVPFLITAILFISFAYSSGQYFPAYSQWQFSYEATNATFETVDSVSTLYVENGVAKLSTLTLENLTKGFKAILNLTVSLSPESVISGLRVLVNGEVIFHKIFEESGNYSIVFFIIDNYQAGSNFTLSFYDIGGKLRVEMEPMRIQVPSEGLSEGLLLTGIGITVVFAVLSILAVIMYLLKPGIFGGSKERKEKKGVTNIRKEKEVVATTRSISGEKEVDEEIVAAITGALSLYLGGRKFRIISVKASPWKYYGRLKQMRRWK